MPRLLPAALVAAALLAGCDALTYSPDGENAVEVPAPEPATLDLRSAPDTVLLAGYVELRYAVSRAGLREVRVYLDDQEVASTPDPASVTFWASDVRDGTYRLRVVAVVEAGTGSLADRLGVEAVETVAERVAVVDNSWPEEGPVVSLAVEDGRLVVRWTRSRRPSFDRYELYRGGQLVATRTDREATQWVDSTYVGGRVGYVVWSETGGLRRSGDAEAGYPPPTVQSAQPVGPGEVRVAWTGTLFTGAFEAYVLRRTSSVGPDEAQGGTPVETVVRSVADMVFIDRPPVEPFGVRYRYAVGTRPEGPYPTGRSRPIWAEPSLGVFPTAYLAGSGRFVGPSRRTGGRFTLRALDGRTLETVAQVATDDSLRAFASPSSDRLFTTEMAGSGAATAVVERDAETLAPVRTLRLPAALGPDARIGEPLYLADGGLLYVTVWEQRGYTTHVGVRVAAWNLETGALEGVLGEADGGGTLLGATADGRFVHVATYGGEAWFERTGPGAFREIEVGVTGGVLLARQGAMARFDGRTVTVHRLPDGAEVRRFTVAPEVEQVEYDAASGLLYGETFSEDRRPFGAEETVVAYDPTTGAEVGRRAVMGETPWSFTRPYVLGGRLWWDGRSRPLALPSARVAALR